MLIIILLLFSAFTFLEIYSNGKHFGVGANPFVILAYHLVRLGFLLVALILLWRFNQTYFFVVFALLTICLLANLIFNNEKRKIKNILMIYKNLKQASPNLEEIDILERTAQAYYKTLGWDQAEIETIIKNLFAKKDKKYPENVKYLAAWLLTYEKPAAIDRFSKRYAIAENLLAVGQK